ncbi:MAG: aldo/keto reductase [Deltaproteobacteria bacterium]|nr:aldo/keto reductase [Deltaproteobacteria bacterium]
MSKKMINRREFITQSSLKLAGAGLLLKQTAAKTAFGEEKKPKPRKKKAPHMEYRTLGKTGLKVSAVSFGTMRVREPAVLFKALDLGINFFDTAQDYPNEDIIGKVAKEYGRKKVLIATKIYPFQTANKTSGKYILHESKVLDLMMEESLKRLQSDYIDVLYLHSAVDKNCLLNEDLLAFLEKLKKEGKVRFVGASLHNLSVLAEVADHFLKPNIFDVLLTVFNSASPPEHTEILKKARKSNVGIVAMKTQTGGYEDGFDTSLSPHQASLKWVLDHDFVDCAIPGMVNIEQVVENVGVVGKKMGWSDRKTLHAYHNAIKHKYCIMCGKCLKTCGNRINITTINRALMYCEGHRDFEKGRRTYLKLSKRESGLSCMNCTSPTCKCANSITIAERMKLAHSLFA